MTRERFAAHGEPAKPYERPSYSPPRVQKLSARAEHLHTVVSRVGHVDPPCIVHSYPMRIEELAVVVAMRAPHPQERARRAEHLYPVVSKVGHIDAPRTFYRYVMDSSELGLTNALGAPRPNCPSSEPSEPHGTHHWH